MGAVSRYVEPKTPGELARVIVTFLASEFGYGCGGGHGEYGGEIEVLLADEDATILVLAQSEVTPLLRPAAKIASGDRYELLSPEEQALVEAHRDGGGSSAGIVDRLRPSSS